MRLKLDENVPIDAAPLLVDAGHDVHTVHDESLAGAPDDHVAEACRREHRLLVTLDLDFSDVRAYPPGSHPGIVVLRPRSPDRESVMTLLGRLQPLLEREALAGCLVIVDAERVRVRAPAR